MTLAAAQASIDQAVAAAFTELQSEVVPQPPPFGPPVTPDPSNTGCPDGVGLTEHDGDLIITEPTWIERLWIRGRLIPRAPVWGRYIHADAGDTSTIGFNTAALDSTHPAASVCLEDSTIEVVNPTVWLNTVLGHDWQLRRCRLSGGVDHLGAYNKTNPQLPLNCEFVDGYADQLFYSATDPNQGGGPTHNDLLQAQGGAGVIRLSRSTLLGTPHPKSSPNNSMFSNGILTSPNVAPVALIIVEDCLIDYAQQALAALSGKLGITGPIVYRRNRHGIHYPTFTHAGTTARWPIVAHTNVAIAGWTNSYVGPDTANGNINTDGSPVMIWRMKP